jgi:hypothetical protein
MGVEFNALLHTRQRPMLQMQFWTQATTFKTKLSSNPSCKAIHFHARFRKMAKNYYELRHVCSSVCPSLRMEKSRLPMDGFLWNFSFDNFRKFFEKIQVSLKSDNNIGYFTWRLIYVLIIFRSILPIMKSVSERVVEKAETHILCSNFFFRKSCLSWDNVEK